MTVMCSECGHRLGDSASSKTIKAMRFCPHCAHELKHLPLKLAFNKVTEALNAFIPYNPV